MKKILFIEMPPPNESGGTGGSLYSLATMVNNILERGNYAIFVLTFYEIPVAKELFDSKVTLLSIVPFKTLSINKKNVLKQKLRWLPRYFKSEAESFRKLLETYKPINRIIKRINPDIVWGNNRISGNLSANYLSRLHSIPYYQHQRNVEHGITLLSFLGFLNCKRVFAISDYIKDQTNINFLKYSKNKIKRVYNLNLASTENKVERKSYKAEEKKLQIIWIGRIIPWKNTIKTVDFAIALKSQDITNFIIKIYGDIYEDRNYYLKVNQLIKDCFLDDCIRFEGYKPLKFIFEQNPHFLIHTSKLPEPFGRVILDSIYNYCIVITNGKGGSGEIVRDGINGLLYNDISLEKTALKMWYLFNNSSTYSKFTRGAIEATNIIINKEDALNIYLDEINNT